MKVAVTEVPRANRPALADLIDYRPGEKATMIQCFSLSPEVWVGWADRSVACVWGVVPPTLLSEQAYLWLWAGDIVPEHQFLFIRHSQLVIEKLLKKYSMIVGLTDPEQKKTARWLKWLGAEITDHVHSSGYVWFTIRRK
jgi:hypothetical protein